MINIFRRKRFKTLLKYIRTFKNWPTAYIGYEKKKDLKREVVLTLRNGLRFFCEIEDVIIIFENWLMKERILEEYGFHIRKNDIIVDIGAHIGTFSVYAGKNAPNGMVYAYEPFPKSFHFLVENLKLNNITNVKPFEMGISGENSERTLFLSPRKDGNALLFSEICSGEEIKIKTVTLKQVFETNHLEKIDFLKIDCEGAEFEILLNLPKYYLNKIERISVECHDKLAKHTTRDLSEYLIENGFYVFIKEKNRDLSNLYAKRCS